jgi:PAS domain S-box-containing protein
LELTNPADVDDNALHWSEEMFRIAGFEPGEVHPCNALFYSLVPAEEHAAIRRAMALAVRERGQYSIVHRLIRADGDMRFVQQSADVLREELTGRPLRIAGLAHDITERRKFETRNRRVIESDAQVVMFWNTNGEITDANDAFLRLTLYTREDLNAGLLDWSMMTPPEYAHVDLRALRELAVDGICAPVEKEWFRKDGSRVPVLLAAAKFDDCPDEGVCFALDLTERIRLEGLRAGERRFKALFDQTIVGVARVDALTGRYLHVNQRFGEILGRSPEELATLTAAEITHPQTVDRDLELVRQIKAGAIREFSVEKRYLHKDKSEVWAKVTISEMWAPGEKPDFYLAIVQDITSHKKLEEQVRQAQKMEAMGTMAGGIAHDFNNIIASINGSAALGQMKLRDNPEVHDCLAAVLTAGHRAAALVRQILAFSRQERLERTPISLRPIVTESIQMLRATIPPSIEFATSLAEDAPTVLADPTQINQVLLNVGTNAWHAMRDRPGRIEFKLERCVVDGASATTHSRLRPGLYARLSVSDTGVGMESGTVRRIFEPFFTTKPQGEGTGLGLAVVHGIMESHDGAATVHSQPGEGTVFHLYFPAHGGGESGAPRPDEGPAPRGHGERILLVDDEVLLAKLGQEWLVGLGYLVEAVTEPEVALALVSANPSGFALVLTDQAMPGMAGLELAEKLRKIRPDLPIVLMTGYGGSLAPEKIEALGIRGLLLKPCTLHSLGSTVHTALCRQAGT